MRTPRDAGETLIEIVVTIVIIGLTVTGLLSGLATIGNAGTAQRISVRADVELRNYAEAIKAAAQDCVPGQPFPTLTYSPSADYRTTGAPTMCPNIATTEADLNLDPIILTVTGPLNLERSMDIQVRTP